MSNQTSLYIDPVSGNVGIGTTTPRTGLDVVGDLVVSGSVSGGLLNTFKNRIINGAMQVNQRGGGGSTETSPLNYTLDRWACAVGGGSGTLAAGQVTLSAADRAATGQINAAVVELAPSTGLAAYFPFDSNVTDASGNGVTLTTTGSMSYVQGRVGSNAVYLANEANVTAGSASANYLTSVFTFPTTFTVSMWMLVTRASASNNSVVFITNSGTAALTNSLVIYFEGVSSKITAGFWGATPPYSITAAINTWYCITVVYNNGTLLFYVNGAYVGTTTGTLAQSNFMLGNGGTTVTAYSFAGFIDDFRIYNRVLSAGEISALANLAPVAPAPATTVASGLTTWLTFDNTTADAQGTLGAPTVTGTTTYSTASKSGTACLDLTANTAGNVTTSTALSYGFTTNTLPLTVSLWLNPSNTSTVQVPFGCTAAVSKGFRFVVNTNGTLYFSAFVGGTEYAVGTVGITVNTWVLLTATVTLSNRITLFVNGNQASVSGVLPSTGTLGAVDTLRIGSTAAANNSYKGLVDDVRIYNRALSPQEVSGLYYAYQPAPYVLFQQPIEGLNVADLGWGTSAAQSAAVSCWIKNNTSTAQQFSLSAGNAGAAAAMTAITFESGIEDTLGFLANPVGTNVVYSTSVYKVGTRALDLTANAVGGTPTSYVSYTLPVPNLSLPVSLSCWIYATSVSLASYTAIIAFLNSGSALNAYSFGFVLNSSGQLYIDCVSSVGVNYITPASAATAVAANRWYHLCATAEAGKGAQLFMNGVLVATGTAIPITTTNIIAYSGSSVNVLYLGCTISSTPLAYAFKGYIDDVRIYNKALTATEIYQLYARNASITTISPYLLPRSYLYTTPSIASGAWQKIIFTIPGDTTNDVWATDTTCGINLALCLGAGGAYVSSGTSGWASAKQFTGSNVQTWGGAATNFLTSVGNSLYLTGVQLEKGTVATPFDVRPYTAELQLCQRYCYSVTGHPMGIIYNANDGYSAMLTFPVTMRSTPVIDSSVAASFHVAGGSAGTVGIRSNITGSTPSKSAVVLYNTSANWTANYLFSATCTITAEL